MTIDQPEHGDLDKQNRQHEQNENASREARRDATDTTTAATAASNAADRDVSAELGASEQAAASKANRTRDARARQREPRAERQAQQEAERQARAQAEYERHPFQWEDTAWQMPAQLLEATLALPAEGYRAWISRHEMYGAVGVQPSAYENPISEYLGKVMGVQPELQTDGQRAWFMLQLTKALRDTEPRYLRVVLPDWVTPLALEYTSFPAARTSGRPQPKEVSAYHAYRLLQRVLADPVTEETDPETDPDRDADQSS